MLHQLTTQQLKVNVLLPVLTEMLSSSYYYYYYFYYIVGLRVPTM
jgi:hypothetical protein